MIRILNKRTAGRDLLRGHVQAVNDLQFFSDDEDILASCGKDGHIFIWKITSTPDTVQYPFDSLRISF
jgi:WD40 repeat protein